MSRQQDHHTNPGMDTNTSGAKRYVKPGSFTRSIFNPFIAALTRSGISVWGSRVLDVRGRTTGQWRSTPVNVLTIDDRRYLVAPRGQTQWVKNIRISGGGRLRVGRRIEEFAAVEIGDDAKPEILRAYLQRWKWEVGQFFDGVGPEASDTELLAVAPGYPVFAVTTA